ncbi:DUF669 domain-containing protein [Bradyrhizobium sp. SZCCHNR2009]|uniref:DUF669 domain-containing protein n=1 Tax=Bradyrhizobium sp. SZCCHNR2009 TaxID=3057375 RepID=UPI0028EEABB5|nr:DUF669 domain-containing protein [Bradyrhizobium sp. SZCCHNR2009]
MADFGVDLNGVEAANSNASGGGAVIPRGRYGFQITEGEIKQNAKRNGDNYSFKAEVTDEGPFNKSVVYGTIVLSNPSAWAQNNGHKQLQALGLAMGFGAGEFTNTDMALYQPFVADVDIETYKKDGQDKERNVFAAFIHEGNANTEPPSDKAPATAPANDNSRAQTNAANSNQPQNNPSTARSTQNGGSSSSGASGGGAAGGRSMPWKRSA